MRGPAEIAYFAQAGVVYEKLLGRRTPVLPRLSATLISPAMSELMERYGLSFCDLFHGGEQVSELLASRVLAPGLQEALQETKGSLERHLEELRAELQKLDPTLVDAASRSQRKMLYQLSKIGSKAARAELRRNAVADAGRLQGADRAVSAQGAAGAGAAGNLLFGAVRAGADWGFEEGGGQAVSGTPDCEAVRARIPEAALRAMRPGGATMEALCQRSRKIPRLKLDLK